MTLGDILKMAAERNLSKRSIDGNLKYVEMIKDGMFEIKLYSDKYEEATLQTSVPYTGKEEDENYARMYFLGMLFNSAIFGMKRLRTKKQYKQ